MGGGYRGTLISCKSSVLEVRLDGARKLEKGKKMNLHKIKRGGGPSHLAGEVPKMEGGDPLTLRVTSCDENRSDWVGYQNPKIWKIAKFSVEAPVYELGGTLDPAGLSPRGVARRGSCWGAP